MRWNMSEKSLLFYENIPKWYNILNKNVYVVRIQLNRIQSYVLGEFGEHPGLESALERAGYIERLMNRMREELFHRLGEGNCLEVMKMTNSVTVSVKKSVPMTQINELALNMQKIIYKVSGGKLELSYCICSATVSPLNDKTSAESNVLDELEEEIQKNRYNSVGLVKLDFHNIGTDSWASQPLNSVSRLSRPSAAEGGKRKPLALIRVDLDNISTFLSKCKCCDFYLDVENKLTAGLKASVESNAYMEVLYVGKDEICVIAVLDQVYDIMNTIREKLESFFKCEQKFSRYSFGVSMAAAPIEYAEDEGIYLPEAFYWAEHLMGVAKKCTGKNMVAMPSELQSIAMTREQCETLARLLKANRYKICNGIQEEVNRVLPDPLALRDALRPYTQGMDSAILGRMGR